MLTAYLLPGHSPQGMELAAVPAVALRSTRSTRSGRFFQPWKDFKCVRTVRKSHQSLCGKTVGFKVCLTGGSHLLGTYQISWQLPGNIFSSPNITRTVRWRGLNEASYPSQPPYNVKNSDLAASAL